MNHVRFSEGIFRRYGSGSLEKPQLIRVKYGPLKIDTNLMPVEVRRSRQYDQIEQDLITEYRITRRQNDSV